MIDGLRPYAEMKPSGVAWLPTLPAGWEIHRAKYSFKEADDRSAAGDEELLSVSHKTGVTPRSQKNITMFMAESYEGHKVCRPGDVVVNTMWAWMAAIGVSHHAGIVSPAYGIYRPRTVNRFESRFLDYLLRTEAYRAEYLRSSRGVTTSRLRLYPPDFLNIPFVQPPLDEQRLIVRFLDWHGSQTSKLIRAKKKIIALLNEQKQAIIHRAVTRGLDTNVKLKPSGVPWLGDIPRHWELKKLKHCLRTPLAYGVLKPDKYAGLDGVPLIRILDVQDGLIKVGQLEQISPAQDEQYVRTRASAGDVLVSVVGTIGRSAVVPPNLGRANLSRALCRVQTSSALLPEFLHLFCLSRAFLDQADSIPAGTAQRVLNLGDLKQFDIGLPPPEEQRDIIRGLLSQTKPFINALEKIRLEIATVQEFRTCLIADVVTGKLDVRGAGASLPDTAELAALEELTEEDDLDEAIDDAENEEVAA